MPRSGSSTLLPLSVFHPLGELFSLLPNIHKVWPAFKNPKWVAHVVLVDLPVPVLETVLALTLNLACPNAPFYRSQGAGAENQAKQNNKGRDNCLKYDVYGERSGDRRGGGEGGCRGSPE